MIPTPADPLASNGSVAGGGVHPPGGTCRPASCRRRQASARALSAGSAGVAAEGRGVAGWLADESARGGVDECSPPLPLSSRSCSGRALAALDAERFWRVAGESRVSGVFAGLFVGGECGRGECSECVDDDRHRTPSVWMVTWYTCACVWSPAVAFVTSVIFVTRTLQHA